MPAAPKRSLARTAQASSPSRITPSTPIPSAVAVSLRHRSSDATTIVASVTPPMISALHRDAGVAPREHEEEDRGDSHERDADDEQQHRDGEPPPRPSGVGRMPRSRQSGALWLGCRLCLGHRHRRRNRLRDRGRNRKQDRDRRRLEHRLRDQRVRLRRWERAIVGRRLGATGGTGPDAHHGSSAAGTG